MGMGRNNNANMNGTFYNPQPQQKKRILTNPISQEKQKELMNKSTQFSLSVTEPEMNSAICSHKDTTKQNLAIRPLGDGRVQCLICGAIMNPDIVNVEYAKDIFQQAENIMHQNKMFHQIPHRDKRQGGKHIGCKQQQYLLQIICIQCQHQALVRL